MPKSLQWVPIMMYATQLNPNQPNHHFTASPVRAREHQIRAPEKCILGVLGRGPYWDNVTVYPYNGYIKSTNPIVRHAMSLTWTMKRILVNYSDTTFTFTWLKHELPSTKSRHIIGAHSRSSYPDNVTVYCYNEHRTDTNLHERCTGIPIWAPIVLFVKLHNLNQSAPCSYDIGTMTENFDMHVCDINHVTCDTFSIPFGTAIRIFYHHISLQRTLCRHKFTCAYAQTFLSKQFYQILCRSKIHSYQLLLLIYF